MSLAELKQVARDHKPPIKNYYIMKRARLIELLSMKELPQEFIIEKKTIHELRKEAKEKNIPNIWNLTKGELMDILYPTKTNLIDNNDKVIKTQCTEPK